MEIEHKKTVIFICILFIIYIGLIFWAKKIETILTFPAPYFSKQEFVPFSDSNLKYEEINIKSSNWYNINWLYVWTWTGKTIYYFHWNWWPINVFYNEIKYIASLWYNVMAFDYPWYWKSEWVPYRWTIQIFSKDFFDYVKQKKQIANNEIIVWWYSIWTAVAVDFAERYNFEKMVLVSPLSSRYDMSRAKIGFAIQKMLFLKSTYNSQELVKYLNKPVLIIHWNDDKLIPFSQWKQVYDNYWKVFIDEWLWNKINKYFIEIDKIGHNFIIDKYWEVLKYEIWKFLSEWTLDFKELLLDDKEIIKLKIKNKLEEDKKKIKSYDFKTDSSITKYVNNIISFDELNYNPSDLEYIKSEFITDSWRWMKLRKEANESLQKLAKEFYAKFSKKLLIVSSFRSYTYQKWIKDWGCSDRFCAKPWFSEHQLWLAIDIFSASSKEIWYTNWEYTKYFDWFKKNAYLYWFHNTYQKWVKTDWYEIEPWHWRYLWVELATNLKENDMTFGEFYKPLP